MHKPSRDDINLLLFAISVAFVITALAFTLAQYAYEHNLLMFAH